MDLLGLIKLILVLGLAGFLVYLITTYIPMSDIFKQVIIVVVAVVLILFIASFLLGGGGEMNLRLR